MLKKKKDSDTKQTRLHYNVMHKEMATDIQSHSQ